MPNISATDPIRGSGGVAPFPQRDRSKRKRRRRDKRDDPPKTPEPADEAEEIAPEPSDRNDDGQPHVDIRV